MNKEKLIFWTKIFLSFLTICVLSYIIHDRVYVNGNNRSKYALGAIGSNRTSWDEVFQNKGYVYIEQGQVYFRNKAEKIRTEARGIEGNARFLTVLTSCSMENFTVAVITDKNEVYINRYKDLDVMYDESKNELSNLTLYLDFIKVKSDEKLVGIVSEEALIPDDCNTMQLFVYTQSGEKKVVEITKEEGLIKEAVVTKSYKDLYTYNRLFDYFSDTVALIYSDNTLSIVDNVFDDYSYTGSNYTFVLNENDEKIKVKELFVSEIFDESNYDIDKMYIVTEDNSIYYVNMLRLNILSNNVVAEIYKELKVEKLTQDGNKIIVEYSNGTKETINNAIYYKK